MNRSDIACCLCKQAHHLLLVDEEDGAVGRRRRAPHADGLTRQASLAEELARAQHRHDGFAARLREHRELHAALLDVQDVLARIALGEDDLASPILDDRFRNPRGVEEGVRVESAFQFGFHANRPQPIVLPVVSAIRKFVALRHLGLGVGGGRCFWLYCLAHMISHATGQHADTCSKSAVRFCRRRAMLYTVAVVLLIMWLLGLVSGYTIGAFIHVLLAFAVVLFLVGLINGRRLA